MNKWINILFVVAFASLSASCSNQAKTVDSKSAAQSTTDIETGAPESNDDAPVLRADEQEVKEQSKSNSAGKVHKINTQQFIEQIFDYKKNPSKWVYKGTKPAIIDFYADWCGPCKRVAPIMEELAKEYNGKVNFYKINTDEERELAGQVFGIRSIPSILYIPVNGQPMMDMGAKPKAAYVQIINEKLLK